MTLYIDTKPTLEWIDYNDRHFADYYEVMKYDGKYYFTFEGYIMHLSNYNTVDEAKAAAKADYERRTAERFKAITLPPRMDARQGDGSVHYCTGWNDVLDAIAKATEATP